jgi:hypothetical protein
MDDFGDFLWFLFGAVTAIVVGGLLWLVNHLIDDDKQRQQRAEAQVLRQPPGESIDDH